MLLDSDSLKIMLLVGVLTALYVSVEFHERARYRPRNTGMQLTYGVSQGVCCQRRLSSGLYEEGRNTKTGRNGTTMIVVLALPGSVVCGYARLNSVVYQWTTAGQCAGLR